ncbi:response regulator transcription factor [Clostridium beijerinckii]|uniref:Heme response regulator HssR n=1 Tax=Clostridium beijerinckii TaxID=1520 RepID=A0A9Q5CF14_CLOBE|nr:response regulator transcription factor [Clostridium beijerinckii]AQS04155.1 heme response regulator HssR [Clostridium beijerinckii]MBA2883958.1 DNA-binding response OmpR family regulator [Clostridium beijerinckii]MBA2899142.1 DNA-binding response OmpR family regulator [Clostridium beijerinckii]MBA2908544.1 DNA-binding response OmpR family regulator [Clostridium beijerinckii]MBA9016296.1 DNA-binding response OmpR family regulator [Clostridium beijerinckii]
MTTILIVEDNKETQSLIASRLKLYFDLICVNDGREALDVIYKNHIHLIVTDIMMSNTNGYEFIKRLRSEKYDTPILIVSTKKSFEDKREGFESGADDYITKPVNYDELFLRVNALLRRSYIEIEQQISFGSVIINATTYSVIWDNRSIVLPQKEFQLLYILFSFPGMIFTENQLLEYIYGFNPNINEDAINMHINTLQNNFKDCEEFKIITAKEGYKAEIKIEI